MEDTGIEIDLYADMDSEFPKEDFKTEKNNLKEVKTEAVDDTTGAGSEGSELYDNVLINIKGEKNTDDDPENSQSLSSSQEYEIRKSSVLPKRYQVYVGNLTWWTTDSDIANAVLDVGVIDFIEVKFFENKTNGQSKGYCSVTLASEASVQTLVKELPKKELHGQTPVVTYATRQALNRFEAQQSTRPTQGSPSVPQFDRPPRSNTTARPYESHKSPPTWLTSMGLPPPPSRLPRGPILPHGAHVNPAFFGPGLGVHVFPPPSSTLSKVEFDEIMGRNRSVSSSAIARFVEAFVNFCINLSLQFIHFKCPKK